MRPKFVIFVTYKNNRTYKKFAYSLQAAIDIKYVSEKEKDVIKVKIEIVK